MKTLVIRRQVFGYARTRIVETMKVDTLSKHYRTLDDYMLRTYSALPSDSLGKDRTFQDSKGLYYVSEVGK